MKRPTLLHGLLMLVMVVSVSAFGQDKPVTNLLKSYIDASNNLGETKQKENVLDLFDSRYKNNTAYVRMSGLVKRTTTGYEYLSNQLDENIKNKNYNFKMSINEIVYESQKEKAGTVSALVNFESKIDDKVAEQGTIMVNLVASLVAGEWKIVHNNTVRVSEVSDIGNCVCYLLEKGSLLVANTYYPAGVEYENDYQSYRISTTAEGQRIIKGDGKDFNWNENGDIFDGDRKVGVATESNEAIRKVLSDMFSKTCTKIDFY